MVSDGNRLAGGMTVGVVDERSELAGCCDGIAVNDLGMADRHFRRVSKSCRNADAAAFHGAGCCGGG